MINKEIRLLRVGDVFLIEKGQKLYIDENDRIDEEVIAGESTSHEEHFVDRIVRKGVEYFSKPYYATVQHTIPPVGKYIVIRTSYEGGRGEGCGMNKCDTYPNGYRVVAIPEKKKHPIVSFYQTGCFTAMLESPVLVRNMLTGTSARR